MALDKIKHYNLRDGNFVLVNGTRISAFAEDAAVAYEVQEDAFEHVVGTDGQVTVSRTNDERVVVTLSLMENSDFNNYLRGLQKLQLRSASTPTLAVFSYLHRDIINGEVVADKEAVFLNHPNPDKARAVGMREWRILLPNAAKNMIFGGG